MQEETKFIHESIVLRKILRSWKNKWQLLFKNKLNAYGEKVTFLGDGVPVYQEQLKEGLQVEYTFAPAHANRQRAAAVGTLAMKYYAEGKVESAREHQPDYLRLSQAERERAEKNADIS